MMLQVRAMQEAAALAAAAAPPLSRDPMAAGARTSSTTTSTTTSSNSVAAAAAAAMTSQATSQQLQPVTVDPADAAKIYALFLRGMFGYRDGGASLEVAKTLLARRESLAAVLGLSGFKLLELHRSEGSRLYTGYATEALERTRGISSDDITLLKECDNVAVTWSWRMFSKYMMVAYFDQHCCLTATFTLAIAAALLTYTQHTACTDDARCASTDTSSVRRAAKPLQKDVSKSTHTR
eukprot:15514-Heterococcus_DN1.PRE.1